MTTRSRNAMPNHPAADANRTRADFLQIDSEVGLTFSGIALTAKDEEKRGRATRVARKAYDTIMRLRKGIKLTDAQRDRLDANLLRLREMLQGLGETF